MGEALGPGVYVLPVDFFPLLTPSQQPTLPSPRPRSDDVDRHGS